MNNKLHRIIIVVFLLQIGSCAFSSCRTKAQSDIQTTITIDEQVKINAIQLVGDTITLQEENILAYSTRVYKDSILIIRNWSTCEHFLEFRRLKDNSIIKECMVKGNGPGEVLSFQYEIANDSIMTAYDVIKSTFSFINIDSLLNYESYTIKENKIPNTILQNASKLNDTIIFKNPYVYANKSIDINYAGKRFLKENELHLLDEYRKNCNIFPYNVNQGIVVSNNDRKRIAYFSYGQALCEFYDSNLNLLNKIEGPDSFDKQKIKIKHDDFQSLSYSGTIPWAYTDIISTNQYVYSIYLGELISNNKYDSNLISTQCYIFQFDWDGNFITCYKTSDYIRTISISNDGKSIYANVFNKAGDSKIVKYTICNSEALQ
ncbi:MAG: hypothetical protein IKY70_05210 [Bacteroidales bacterium]|nr:hypothetical protein [Bacteroidales bacterium]